MDIISADDVLSLAESILEDAAFSTAVSTLCVELRRIFEEEPRLVRAVGDAGAFAIILSAIGIAEEGEGRFTFAEVQAIVVPRGWASSRRVRSLIDWLEWTGAALRHATRDDGRERPWSFCGWLPPAVSALARAFLAATAPWRRRPALHPPYQGDAAEINAIVGAVSRQMRVAPHQISFGTEMSLFAGHAAGLLILLEIFNRSQSAEGPRLRVRFSRKASSRIYGVSRAHITAILAKAEQSHMLVRDGNEILLDETMLSNVQHDLACQLAFVVLADGGKPVAEPI